MKKFSLPILLLLCLGVLQAQQTEGIDGIAVAPRANVISYDDENAIEHLLYDDSPFYLSLDRDWNSGVEEGRLMLSQHYDFPKDWKSYRVFFRMSAPAGYGFFIDDRLIGVSHGVGALSEFDITEQVRFGKTAVISIRYTGESEWEKLEDFTNSETPLISSAILLKPLLNVQDYSISTSYTPSSREGSYQLDVDLYNQKRKGRCYLEVEMWDAKGHQVEKLGKWCFFDKRSESSQTLSSSLAGVQPWSAEVPRLYTAVIRLYDEKMELQDVVGTRFGFRSLGDRNTLTVNDKKITLKGVTFSSSIGSTAEELKALRQELVLMKCNNINAIRIMGLHPYPEKLLELCDELGFYVVCDAALMPLSSMGNAVAADNENSDLFNERVRSLYGQLKNHTSIIAWSLGASKDNGVCMQSAYRALRQIDPQRPILYGEAQYADNTDIIAPDNCSVNTLNQYLSKGQSRSLVMNTFGSVRGNNMGGLATLWQKVSEHESIQGGFCNIGKWGDINGKPYLAELKQVYSPIVVELVSTSSDAAEFVISNVSDFKSLSDYQLEYVIYSNLKPNVVSGDVAMALRPGESKEFKLKVPSLLLYAGEELYIKFVLRQRGHSATVPKNYVLYVVQYPLPSQNMPQQDYANMDGTAFKIEKDSVHQITISNNNVTLVYNDSTGLMTHLSYRGQKMITRSPQINFMRNPSPNDQVDPNGLKQWLRYEMGTLQREVETSNIRTMADGSIGFDVMARYHSDRNGVMFDVRQAYLVLQTGDILINNDITMSDQIKSVARIGVQLGVSRAFDSAVWFGRNVESYSDRQCAGQLAQQQRPVADLLYHYAQPSQHAGNYAQTRWAALHNGTYGLYVDVLDTLWNFSAYPYADEDLAIARSWKELRDTGDITLNIDYRMTGVGGATWGSELREKDLVKEHKYSFAVHLRPYDCQESAPQDFRRITYPKVVSNIVEMPVIKKGRDRFDGPMPITITCPTQKAEIRYTLDGSVPTEKSSLYTKPFTISNSVIVKARAFKKGEAPSFVATEQYSFDYVVSCKFAHKPNTPYNKNASRALFDGEMGDVNDLSRGWLGFSGHDVQVDLELGKSISMSSIVLRFAHVPDAWVFAPAEVKVSVSSDGKEYSAYYPAEITYDAASEQMNTTQLQVVELPVNSDDVRFVRVVARPIAKIPDWHRAKGLNGWIMMDEIEIKEIVTK